MVKLNKIYTRTGDDGTTGLGDGARVAKYDLRVEAYGTVDEANAAIGMARMALASGAADWQQVDVILARIQNELFDLGADLCTPESETPPPYPALRIIEGQVSALEGDIDRLNEALSPLKSFVLPGGSAPAAALHLARTIARRAERVMVALAQEPGQKVGAPALKYINRLSDFLFVASRFVNARGAGDVLWVPGKTRAI